MKKRLLVACLVPFVLTGCGEEVNTGRVEVPPSQDGVLSDIPKQTTYVKNIYIKYQDRFEVKTAVLDFQPKGIILGTQSPMIPLDEKESQLQSLGFRTNISNDGEEAQLLYNDSVIRLKVGDTSLFINDEPGQQMADAPIYNNTTIYVPIIPILDALKLDYNITGEDLTIGGMYTDDSGQPNPSDSSTR